MARATQAALLLQSITPILLILLWQRSPTFAVNERDLDQAAPFPLRYRRRRFRRRNAFDRRGMRGDLNRHKAWWADGGAAKRAK
jgi:hypothetical protein